jgi:hypothetical protein
MASSWFFFDGGITLEGTVEAVQEENGYVTLRVDSDDDHMFFVECTQDASEGIIEGDIIDDLEGAEVSFTPALQTWGDGEKITWKLTKRSLEDMDAAA